MKRAAIVAALVAVAAVGTAHWYFSDRGRFTTAPEFAGLERRFAGDALVSETDPTVTLRVAAPYRYLGGQKFLLYGVADAEQHFFVEPGPDGELLSLYWIQFEGYRPDNEYRYDYEDSPSRMRLDGFEFYVDTAVVESDPSRRRRGSDGSLARAFLADSGYGLPADYVYVRLVHLTDATRRKELMIIFLEDLTPTGMTAADLGADGEQESLWPGVEERTLEKIRRTLELLAPDRGPEG